MEALGRCSYLCSHAAPDLSNRPRDDSQGDVSSSVAAGAPSLFLEINVHASGVPLTDGRRCD